MADYETQAEESGDRSRNVVPLTDEQFASLPEFAQPLVEHIRLGQEVLPD